MVEALRSSGWTVREALGNFVWLRTGDRTPEIDAALREHAVIARAYGTDGVRVTVGSAEMNDRFLAAIAGVEAV
jgi:histidinol-phosphate aminotransferase